ncbi:MAG: hypothetical protein LPK21_03660, partial [Hymenobacteraceae bacterium]|nr:hypothetical protein [Hymenobacteraceae bacterium]MDX5511310.1 hypothetical protein [Hymenobacteraceae bacterium]
MSLIRKNTNSGTIESLLKLLLFFLWLILQSYWFLKHGVRVMGDTPNYLAYAQNIADRFYFENNYYIKYFGYPLYLAFLMKAGLSLKGIVVVQI